MPHHKNYIVFVEAIDFEFLKWTELAVLRVTFVIPAVHMGIPQRTTL